MIIIGTPHTKNAGYYMNDDRNGGGKLSEADIRTCVHCQALIKMQEWKDDGGFCRTCHAPICGPCGDDMLKYGCVPFLKRLEKHTDAVVKFERYLKFAGLEAPKTIITI